MARESLVQRQKLRMHLASNLINKRKIIKQSMSFTKKNEKNKIYYLSKKLQKLPRNSLSIRLRNRCQFTGRSRGYLRGWRISRMMFRTFASQGLLSGVFKASW